MSHAEQPAIQSGSGFEFFVVFQGAEASGLCQIEGRITVRR